MASPYYVITDREQNPAERVVLTELLGFLTAGVFLWTIAIYAFTDEARRK